MKLEFKHLAFYYPYQLYFYNNNHCEIMTRCYMDGYALMIELNGHYKQCFTAAAYYENTKDFKPIWKPVLRPLEDLKINKQIQSKVLLEIFNSTGMTYGFNTIMNCGLKKIPLCVMEILLKYHFDIFGLIEKGLAVDINRIPLV